MLRDLSDDVEKAKRMTVVRDEAFQDDFCSGCRNGPLATLPDADSQPQREQGDHENISLQSLGAIEHCKDTLFEIRKTLHPPVSCLMLDRPADKSLFDWEPIALAVS